MRKGIILAGGAGSRLSPLTFAVTKQLLPVYDKPMIYYPLSTLLDLGINDILLISTEDDKSQFKKLLGDGSNFGIKLSYETQKRPNGIAEGLIIGEKFLSNHPCVFILGDNLFVGSMSQYKFRKEIENKKGATIFTYKVNDPERYGIVTLNKKSKPLNITEKPKQPTSNNAITGIYFYDNNAVQIAKTLKPSNRNELEITDINQNYLNNNLLRVMVLDNDITWLDAGTISSFYEASNMISVIEKRTGKKIGCLEELAYLQNKISLKDLIKSRNRYGSSDYGFYLQKIIENHVKLGPKIE